MLTDGFSEGRSLMKQARLANVRRGSHFAGHFGCRARLDFVIQNVAPSKINFSLITISSRITDIRSGAT